MIKANSDIKRGEKMVALSYDIASQKYAKFIKRGKSKKDIKAGEVVDLNMIELFPPEFKKRVGRQIRGQS